MSIFGGLFGHDKKSDPSLRTSQLPTPPPMAADGGPGPGSVFSQVPAALQPSAAAALPAPPPKRASPFDPEHYRQTMLALAAGFFGGNGLGEGLANAAKSIAAQDVGLNKVSRPVIGGPDNAFEVYTDPNTGQHTYKPIQPAMDYLRRKQEKPKDVADLNGRVMYAISQLPEAQQAHAFDDVRSNPELYGVDPTHLPTTWSPNYGKVAGITGMTVSQAMTRQQATAAEQGRAADRATRTGIMQTRADAATRQGDQRLSLAGQALNLRKGKGGKTGKAASPAVSSMSTADLLAMIGH